MRLPSLCVVAALLGGSSLGMAQSAAAGRPARPRPAPPAPVVAPAAPTAPTRGTLHVSIALVLPDLTMRPVPMHALELVATADTTVRHAVRTGGDGMAHQEIAVGRYRVRSVQAVTLRDSSYRWDDVVEITTADTRLELTNATAAVAAVAVVALPVARQMAPERAVFEQIRRGVFRVESGLGHGSGFLAAIPG